MKISLLVAASAGFYDPNEPSAQGRITFDRTERCLVATRVFDTRPGPIRTFRVCYWPLR